MFTDQVLPEDLDLDQMSSDSSITGDMTLDRVQHKDPGSYEIIVADPCLGLLSSRLPGFNVAVDYDPFVPCEGDVLAYGIDEAEGMARVSALHNIAQAIRREGSRKYAECYRIAARRAGLNAALKRVILYSDIQVTWPHIRFSLRLLTLIRKPTSTSV